jgi:hypothetical protein
MRGDLGHAESTINVVHGGLRRVGTIRREVGHVPRKRISTSILSPVDSIETRHIAET